MTKEITLSLGERLASIKILNEFKGALSELAVILDDVKKFAITEEDWKNANLVKTPAGEGKENWNWEDTEKQLKTITIDQITVECIKKGIDEKSKANQITVSDVALISLEKKIN